MKFTYFKILLTFTVSAFFLSCQKQVDVIPNQDVSFANERLIFKNEALFDKIALSSKNPKLISSEFVSMLDAYNQITEQQRIEIGQTLDISAYQNFLYISKDNSGDLIAEPNVEDVVLAKWLDKNGLVQVGNQVRKYTKESILVIDNPTEEQISVLKLASSNNLPNYINLIAYPKPISQNRCGNIDETATYTHSGKSKRVSAETQFKTYGQGVGIRVTTKHQIKTLGIWWADQASELSHSSTGTICTVGGCSTTFYPAGGSPTTNPSASTTNDNMFSGDVDYRVPGAYSAPLHVYTTHTVKCDDGINRSVITDICL